MHCGFVRPQRHGRPEPARPDLSNAPAWLLPSLQVKPSSPSVTAPDPSEHSYPFTGSFPQTRQGLYLHTLGSPQDLVRTGAYSGTAN